MLIILNVFSQADFLPKSLFIPIAQPACRWSWLLAAQPRNPMLTETASHGSAGVTQREAGLHGNYRRIYADIRALDRALVLADLPAARKAFTQLQTDSPLIAEAMSRDPFPARTRPLKALKVLGRCLLRGNWPGARQAFESFH